MFKLTLLLILSVLVSFCGCRSSEVPHRPEVVTLSDKPEQTRVEEPTVVAETLAAGEGQSEQASPSGPPPEAVIQGLNNFSIALYNDVAKNHHSNLAVSPLGSYILIAMLHTGAQGAAREAIEENLGIDDSSLQGVSALVSSLDAAPSLNIAQKIYLSFQTSIFPEYLSRVSPLLIDPTERVPFLEDPEKAVAIINEWVEEKTAGLIQDFLPKLPRQTLSVLVSVLHFKGQWAVKFDPRNTTAAHFTRSDGSKITVPMMRLKTTLPLRQTETGTLVTLKYTDETECLLFLPNPGHSPESLLLDPESQELLTSAFLPPEKIRLELPRFEFETDTFSLTKAWSNLGLAPLVSDPNLSGMLEFTGKVPRLDLLVFHKTYVKVDEEGTEAAAATAVAVVARGAAAQPEPLLVRFDRPFLFLLRHSESKAIFMLGRVEQPEIWKSPE